MTPTYCPICGQLYPDLSHHCPANWLVHINRGPNYTTDSPPIPIRAFNELRAALEFTRRYDQEGLTYRIARDSQILSVTVVNNVEPDTEPQIFTVTGAWISIGASAWIPHYIATKEQTP